jgi:hypothetical protein
MIIFQKITDFFKNLQQKPEDVRRRWLWIFVISLTAIIFVFWLASFTKNIQANLSPLASPSPTVSEVAEAESSSSDFLPILVGGFKKTANGVMSFLQPVAAAVARFFVTIFSFILKAGAWLIHELSNVFNDAKTRLQSGASSFQAATRGLTETNQEISLQLESYFSLALATISQK